MDNYYIEIVTPERMKPTRWNRFKVSIWNFILPPHLHLNLRKKGENTNKEEG